MNQELEKRFHIEPLIAPRVRHTKPINGALRDWLRSNFNAALEAMLMHRGVAGPTGAAAADRCRASERATSAYP